jgi:site-specific DNA-cytosine methylase
MEVCQNPRLRCPSDSWTNHHYSCLVLLPSSILNYSPGQPMPSFPPQTHGSPPLLPYKCLVDAISNITFPDPLHDPRPFPYPRFSTINPYLPFPVTIIASGNTGNVYPDGTRPFTKRELARCQTFDDTHIFGNVCIERQSTAFNLWI